MNNASRLGFADFKDKMDRMCREHAQDYVISCMMANGRRVDLRYSRLAFLIAGFAPVRERYGLRDGDRVLLLTPPIADALISFEVLACNHLTVVIADAGIPKEELLRLIADARVSAVFTDKKHFAAVKSVDSVPIFRTWGLTSDLELLQPAARPAEPSEPTPDSVAIIFSSGTTSRMKPIEIPYESLLLCAQRNYAVMDLNPRRAKMPFLMLFPMSHISGLACASGMALSGLTIATAETVNSASLLGSIHLFQPVEFGMVPKVLAMFVDKMEEELRSRHMFGFYKACRAVSAFFRTKLGIRAVGRAVMTPFRKALFGKNMYVVLCGGAPCTPAIASAMLDLGVNFVINYSSTECGVPIMQTDVTVNDCLDGVGRADCDPNVQIRINAPDSAGIGEIYVKTRYIMKGYYNEPELTAAAFDGEWFRTGDNGFIDKKGYLHIAGRSKDSIMLSSGKKVAPDDLENLLLPVIGLQTPYSVVGVPDSAAGCDAIHVFIEGEFEEEEKKALAARIGEWQRAEAKLYPIEDIHFIKQMPKTSIGKVKRVKLREMVAEEKKGRAARPADDPVAAAADVPADKAADVLGTVNEIVTRVAGLTEPLTGYEDLVRDLGIDSLTMMEICTEIESIYGVFIGTYLKVLPNTIEIAEYIKDPIFISKSAAKTGGTAKFNAFTFPKPRKPIHRWLFRKGGDWFAKKIDFEVSGLEKLQKGESYIFCPNHQTHMDGLWVWHALGDKCPPVDTIGCMAKMEHLDTAPTRLMLTVLGGIPVDRSGNTMDSFKRSIEFIRAGNCFLIHPEGTRTRDGKLGPFKSGAALMAIESGVQIVPVAIDGGLSVWRYDMKLPKTKDPATGKKRRVRITFCDPIAPEAGAEERMTEAMRRAVAGVLGEA